MVKRSFILGAVLALTAMLSGCAQYSGNGTDPRHAHYIEVPTNNGSVGCIVTSGKNSAGISCDWSK